MDRLKNIGKKLFINSASCFVIFFSHYSVAGISGDSYWIIESGDSVYSIARNIFPNDTGKQRQFRKELITNNHSVFKGKADRINVGDKLRLPAFAISKPVKLEEKITTAPAVSVSPAIEAKENRIITPDPEEVIGHVIVNVGKMQASNRGTFRELLRNSKVFKGDTIKTSANSYTQIRMKDGALLSLRPNTELVIRNYNFNGKEDGSERSFMELLRGGFRTITGYIGHKNKNNYRIKTAVATIGIRGTHYGLMLCADNSCSNETEPLEDGIYGGVVDGSILISNNSGEYTFNNDQYFHIASASSAAIELLVPPPVFHGNSEKVYNAKKNASQQQNPQQESNKDKKHEAKPALTNKTKTLNGSIDTKKVRGNRLGALVMSYINNKPQPLVLPDQINDVIKDKPAFVPAPNGSAVLVSMRGTDINNNPDYIAASIIVAETIDSQIILGSKLTPEGFIIRNIPVAMHGLDNGNVYELFLPSATAGVNYIAGDPIGVNWGRWTGDYSLTENGTNLPTQGDLHYVYSDKITSPTQIAALGGLLTTASYTLVGNTTPTDPSGNELILNSLTISADFVAQQVTDYTVSITNIDGSPAFDMSAQNIPFLTPDITNGNVMRDFNLSSTNCTSCTGNATAAFIGNEAQGVITTYSVGDINVPTVGASGAAVLVR